MEQVLFRLPPEIRKKFKAALKYRRVTQQDALTEFVLQFISDTKDKEAA